MVVRILCIIVFVFQEMGGKLRRSARNRSGRFEAIMIALKKNQQKRRTKKHQGLGKWFLEEHIVSSIGKVYYLRCPSFKYYGSSPPAGSIHTRSCLINNPWEEKEL
jgi:hypothetical protein